MFVPSDPPASTRETVGDEPSQLTIARSSQSVIAAAKHVLMERHGIDAFEAFELLRQYGRRSDLPIRDVARRLVHDRWLPPEGPGQDPPAP